MLRTILMASGLAFVLALSACGEGGGDGVPAQEPPPAAQPTTPPAQQ